PPYTYLLSLHDALPIFPGRQESTRSRQGREARSPDRCAEKEMRKGRRRRAANCAPKRRGPLARQGPEDPSLERGCLPSDGCTPTMLFPRECLVAFPSGRERRIQE